MVLDLVEPQLIVLSIRLSHIYEIRFQVFISAHFFGLEAIESSCLQFVLN